MRRVGAVEARNRFGKLLDWVGSGEEVIITRRGKAIARMVPNVAMVDRVAARWAVKGILARRRAMALGGLKINSLVTEERR